MFLQQMSIFITLHRHNLSKFKHALVDETINIQLYINHLTLHDLFKVVSLRNKTNL